jgi:hypothetical protein
MPDRAAFAHNRCELDPSQIDDVAFVAELEQLELRGPSRAIVAPPPRDANRWNHRPPSGVQPERRIAASDAVQQTAWAPILIGFGAGAAGAAALLSDRLALIVRMLAP